MCIYVTIISVCHTFHILRELPCCFYFQNLSCCLLNGTNSTAKVQMNRTMNISDSVKINGWKVSLIYFFNYWWHWTVKVYNVISVNNISEVHQLFSKDGTEIPFLQGISNGYPTHNHLFTTNILSNVWVYYTKIIQN